MKLSLIFTSIAILLTSVHSQSYAVVTDRFLNVNQALIPANIECANVFIANHLFTVGSLPNVPYLAEGPVVANEPNSESDLDDITGCATCWTLTSISTGLSANFLMAGYASNFGISPIAMDYLNNYGSSVPPSFAVTAVQASPSDCKYTPPS